MNTTYTVTLPLTRVLVVAVCPSSATSTLGVKQFKLPLLAIGLSVPHNVIVPSTVVVVVTISLYIPSGKSTLTVISSMFSSTFVIDVSKYGVG